MPTSADRKAGWHGHAMLCVGYSDADEFFIVRNSPGTEFGLDGYCYIPYEHMMSYNYRDSWIIKHVDALGPDKSTWSTEEDRVLDRADALLLKRAASLRAAKACLDEDLLLRQPAPPVQGREGIRDVRPGVRPRTRGVVTSGGRPARTEK